MSFSDETLAAYVDGELDPAAGAEIEEAARRDPSIGARLEQYRALRRRLRAAYAVELEEPVPDRLLAALRSPAPDGSSVLDLRTARAAKKHRNAATARRRYSLAASVLIAVGVGFFSWHHFHSSAIERVNGTLFARGALAAGLSDQLSGAGTFGAGVRIGLSFVAKSGRYCRTFAFAADAGLACSDAGRWEILVLAKPATSEVASSGFRTASSAIPVTVLEAAEREMSGEPLDRAGEMSARRRHWSNPPPPASTAPPP